MIKLVAIDIDGTLLNSKRELTDVVKTTIKKATEQGIKIVLCTGRPLQGVQALLKELDLVSNDQYVITYNGSLVQTADGKRTIVEYALDLNQVLWIKEIADELGTFYHAIDRRSIYTTNQPIGYYTRHESQLVDMPITSVSSSELQQLDTVFQKAMIVDDEKVLSRVIEQLPHALNEQLYVVKSAPYYLEILHPLANKGNAVKALAEELGFSLDEVMAIGDNMNDLEMIKVAGIGVAMGNAVNGLKKFADVITKTNDENGVAFALSEWANVK